MGTSGKLLWNSHMPCWLSRWRRPTKRCTTRGLFWFCACNGMGLTGPKISCWMHHRNTSFCGSWWWESLTSSVHVSRGRPKERPFGLSAEIDEHGTTEMVRSFGFFLPKEFFRSNEVLLAERHTFGRKYGRNKLYNLAEIDLFGRNWLFGRKYLFRPKLSF